MNVMHCQKSWRERRWEGGTAHGDRVASGVDAVTGATDPSRVPGGG
jgi:hypothetical protein